MEAPVRSKPSFRFGIFQADSNGELLRKGARVRLQDQPFRLLMVLLERAGEIVSRDELRQKLWPSDTYVEFDGSLNNTLKKLRAALGDSAENPTFIETIPKRGYRFIAPVVRSQEPAENEDSSPTTAPVASAASVAKAQTHLIAEKSGRRRTVLASAALLLFALLVVASYHRLTSAGEGKDVQRTLPSQVAQRPSVAVLPFSNEGAGPDVDFLRYAIAEDLVTDLAHAQAVSVRPFSSTARYASQPFDPTVVGKELRVAYVVTGGFLRDNKGLRVNLELVDVAHNQPAWREELAISPQELVALHGKLAASAAHGLLPAMNVSATPPAEVHPPSNEHALDLFFHSLTLPLEPGPNRLAIRKLEESLSIDDKYAPAWEQLAWRYYMDFHYGNGGEAAITKSLEASRRQSELDPNTPPVSITISVEQGDLDSAYAKAAEFLRRRPDSTMAHFWMSYVLRFAGLLDEATRQCDAALALDPGFNMLRSCAFPFVMAGDYARAERYIRLDESFGAFMRMRIALRTGNAAAALATSSEATQAGFSRADVSLALFRTCLSRAPEAQLHKAVAKMEADRVALLDHELFYQNAEDLAFCRQWDAALRQLSKAIEGNYCSYPAMDKDPVFDPIRQRPEFAALRAAAVQCQQAFLTHRKQVDAGSPASP